MASWGVRRLRVLSLRRKSDAAMKSKMLPELVVRVVVVALNGRFFYGAVHSFDLTVGGGMRRLERGPRGCRCCRATLPLDLNTRSRSCYRPLTRTRIPKSRGRIKPEWARPALSLNARLDAGGRQTVGWRNPLRPPASS